MKFVGIVHWDFEGERRLGELLQREAPKTITLEAPRCVQLANLVNTMIAIRKKGLEKLEEDEYANISQLLSPIIKVEGYEWFVTLAYARRSGAEVYGVDHKGLLNMLTNDLEHIEVRLQRKREELEELIKDYPEMFVQNRIDLRKWQIFIDRLYYGPGSMLLPGEIMSEKKGEIVAVREAAMLRGIRKHRPDVHIGGIAHLAAEFSAYKSSPPLYEQAGFSKESLIRLCELD